MLLMQEEEETKSPAIPLPPIAPNGVAMALFNTGRLTLHVDGSDNGLCTTVALDGEYLSGVAHSWPEVAMLVNTAVRRLICGYMHDVAEQDMPPRLLFADAARHYGISIRDTAVGGLLLRWAEDVKNVC